jgi:hypothetical protein
MANQMQYQQASRHQGVLEAGAGAATDIETSQLLVVL